MKTFSTFLTEEKEKPKELETVDFRDKEKITPLKTVDFRDKKHVSEESLDEEEQSWTDYSTGPKHTKDVKALHKKLSKNSEDEYVPSAVKNYTQGSSFLNKSLFKSKGKVPNASAQKVKDIDEHLSTSHSPHSFDVYSGLHFEPTPGLHVHHGYMSSSISRNIAKQFAKSNMTFKPYKNVRHILKIHVPKDSTHGAYIAPHSSYDTEHEFLIGRGKKIRIHPNPQVFHLSSGNQIHVHTGTFED